MSNNSMSFTSDLINIEDRGNRISKCQQCKNRAYFSVTIKECGHIQCEDCFTDYLNSTKGSTSKPICTVCSREFQNVYTDTETMEYRLKRIQSNVNKKES